MGARLGQHFLRDERIAKRIVEAAGIEATDHVLEIGPGARALTDLLRVALPGGRLTCIEADERLAADVAAACPDVEVHSADVLRVDLAALGPFDRIVSNLPYDISGPITKRLLDLQRDQGWKRAVLMYQKEFADRLLAGPGSKTYGRLSVHTARWCHAARLRDVPPGAFDPPPKVRSTIMTLEPCDPFPADDATLEAVVDAAFGQRRKKLSNSLASVPGAVEAATALGIADRRPEAVDPVTFGALARAIHGG